MRYWITYTFSLFSILNGIFHIFASQTFLALGIIKASFASALVSERFIRLQCTALVALMLPSLGIANEFAMLSTIATLRPHSKMKSADFVYVAWPRDSK